MLLELNSIIELEFLFYLVPVFLGMQIAIYFYYQYYKSRYPNLNLNRILLSFGTFIVLIIIGALGNQIVRIFISDIELQQIINKISWVIAFSAPIGFDIFLIGKDFTKILNQFVLNGLMTLNVIAIILALIAPSTNSLLFNIATIFVLINGINTLYLEVILIKKSKGKIKSKFKLFFFGTCISLLSIFFAIIVSLNILSTLSSQLIIYFMGVGLLTLGFIIISFSAYKFPPFYEFEWRRNLSKLIILSKNLNQCLYYFDFSDLLYFSKKNPEFESYIPRKKERLLSQGLIGIESIISIITDSSSEKIDKIQHEESYIIFEYGTISPDLIFALIIKEDLISLRYFLKEIKSQFEGFYRILLTNLDKFQTNQELIFGSFDILLEDLMR